MSARMDQIIIRLFGRLQGIYGTAFTNKFSTGINRDGVDVGFDNAKLVWADELHGFAENLDAVAYALRNVDPKFPPSAREFLVLCRAAPRKDAPALAYTPTAEDVERARAAADTATKSVKQRGDNFEVEVWAMQPRSHAHFDLIVAAIASQPARFGDCLRKLIERGVVSEEGRLLKLYRGSEQWVKA